jgi:hypothetical protein
MSRTPKDAENLEVLDTLITTASLCFVGLAQGLQLRSVINSDPLLVRWYSQATGGAKSG